MKTLYDTVLKVAGSGSLEMGITKAYARGDVIKVAGHHYIVTRVKVTPAPPGEKYACQEVDVVSDPVW